MNFRTELKIIPFEQPIAHSDALLSLGSCFAEGVAQRLAERKFRIVINPTGTLFNPLSILQTLQRALRNEPYHREELSQHLNDEAYFLYELPTRFTSNDPDEVLRRANEAQQQLCEGFRQAKHLLITFGTAWTYRRISTGKLVANCHKQPAQLFQRERLTTEQIVAPWRDFVEQYPDKQFIFTVSPIRHLGDGLPGNAVSKATLRLACEELTERCANSCYFPAFEALTDDLRDYRFYADDLCHPTPMAIDYISQLFLQAAVTAEGRAAAQEALRLVHFARHEPFQPNSDAYRATASRIIAKMKASNCDFSDEIARIEARL